MKFKVYFTHSDGTPDEIYTLADKKIEILGNVYDNPELINPKYPYIPKDN